MLSCTMDFSLLRPRRFLPSRSARRCARGDPVRVPVCASGQGGGGGEKDVGHKRERIRNVDAGRVGSNFEH